MALRSHTIVPRDLYVQRRADTQLSQIISDMGRPGYVLVARQMGKTNLLLNAKRNASSDDLFVYLDVSNVFPDERSFFRNIIDVALDSLREAAVFLKSTIEQERIGDATLPHKEHERELRRLLQSVSGKLIVCLDEIDALTKTSYSDQIFSFIRSIYFSGRANIHEFERLTYVLSGVAEPSDLIKNKAISPFNIGEKIYLDDFTRDEVEEFLIRAGISLPTAVRERIFLWTNGHPRMTWDLVSEIERRGAIHDPDVVDSVVRELYFGSVDIPPVDHIKALVEASREVKDALMAMHYGKASTISDGIRTKLYLAGISRFDTESREVFFKNRILELALSEEFLNSIEQRQPSYEVAIKNLHAKLYSDALIGFTEVLSTQPSDSRVPLAQYWAGVCCYYLGRYREAIAYFSVSNANLPVTSIVSRYFFHGMAHLLLGDARAAVPLLAQAVQGGGVSDFPDTFFEAKVSLARAILESGPPDSIALHQATELSEGVVKEADFISATSADPNGLEGLLLRAYLNLARAAQFRKDRDAAVKFLEEAGRHAGSAARLHLLLFEHELARSHDEAEVVLQKAVSEAYNIRSFDADRGVTPVAALQDVLRLMEKLQRQRKFDELAQVIDHVLSHMSDKVDVFEFLGEVLVDIFNQGNTRIASAILHRALAVASTRGPSVTQRNLLGLGIVMNETEADQYGVDYLSTFEHPGAVVLHTDLRFISAVVLAAAAHGNQPLAVRARDLIAERLADPSTDEAPTATSVALVREYIELVVGLRFTADKGVLAQASAFLRKLSGLRSFNLAYFPAHYHRAMQADILDRLRSKTRPPPFKRDHRKIGRNDVVVVDYGGTQKRGKYKNFASDIASGLCQIVDAPPS